MGCARRSGQGYRLSGARVDRRPARLANRPGRESAQQRSFRFVGPDQHLAQRRVARVEDSA
jgi:hypothetical protein